MTSASEGTERMSVSVIAGPGAAAVIAKLRGITLFDQRPDSKPEEIMARLREIARNGEVDHLVIQCEAERPLMAYAFLFADELANVSQLASAVFVIDSITLVDLLLDRKATQLSACFIAEQIEFASDIFLAGDNRPDFELARSITMALNPEARVSLSTDDAMARIARPQTTFDFEQAISSPGWRKLLDAEHSSASASDRITKFAYCARRPFQPERFSSLLQQGLRGVFRAKGFFWLATRMDEVGGLNLAGSELQCASAGHWWATRDTHARESEMPARTRSQWQEPFGDRRQSFAIMALNIRQDALRQQLDGCLLTDDEMAQGETAWRNFPDPFPSWRAHSHSHEQHDDCECDHHHHDHG